MSTGAVVPIKNLDHAKQRLSGLLTASERKGLFTAMVEDVLIALGATDGVDEVLVVTDDDEVARLSQRHGAALLPEPRKPGLIEAVTAAAAELVERGFARMVFVPGDIPLLSQEELAVMLAAEREGEKPLFAIAPARDLGGSNCVVCSPPNAIEFGFGVDSFRRHLRIARRLGLEPLVMKLPGIGLDVDTPDDLGRLIRVLGERELDSLTHKYLLSIEIEERLGATKEQAV